MFTSGKELVKNALAKVKELLANSKFNKALEPIKNKLSKLKDGTRQMSTEWIEGGKSASRLSLSVGENVADDILLEGY